MPLAESLVRTIRVSQLPETLGTPLDRLSIGVAQPVQAERELVQPFQPVRDPETQAEQICVHETPLQPAAVERVRTELVMHP